MTERMEEELVKMYALRAGISQVAIENDAVTSIRTQEQTELKVVINDSKELQSAIDSANKKIEDDKIQIKNDEARKACTEKLLKATQKTRAKRAITVLITLAVIVILILDMTVYYVREHRRLFNFWQWLLIAVVAITVFVIVLKLTWFITEKQYDKFSMKKECCFWGVSSYNIFTSSSRDTKKSITYLEDEIEKLEEFVEKNTNSIKENKASLTNNDLQIKEIEERANKEAFPYCLRASAVYKGLVEEFGNFIDERDWEYLDLIIFAYESGRAENLKEALKFIDEERRTNQITKAVYTATQYICGTIVKGFRSMEQSLSQHFERLSKQIEKNAARQVRELDAMNKSMIKSNSQIVAGIDYNNALMKKRDESSKEIMHAIRPFINRAETDIRYRMTGLY